MKKIGLWIMIGILCLGILPVKAANYEVRELIPEKIETTIVTDHFSYRSFYYNGEESINFKTIKNISKTNLPISISIGLFNDKKKNIGTINYCAKEDVFASQEEKSYSIPITKEYLGEEFTTQDIHYIAVLSENINCRTTGSEDFIGQTVEEIGQPKNTGLDTHTTLFINVMLVVGGLVLAYYLYKLMFTRSYENMDGEDVRIGYKKYNKELKERREFEERMHPKEPEVKKKEKSDQILEEEELAKNEDKTGTDLHNLYK